MNTFDGILNGLTVENSTGTAEQVKQEICRQVVSVAAASYYQSDADLGKRIKDVITDSINNHLYYEL